MLGYDVDIVVGDDDASEELIRLCFCFFVCWYQLVIFILGVLAPEYDHIK